MAKKVFVFGIDGAMPEKVFGEWLDDLPTIKGLMEKGCYAKLNSTVPPLSGTAWISMVTGKSPSDTSIFEYVFRKNFAYEELSVISSHNIKQKTISINSCPVTGCKIGNKCPCQLPTNIKRVYS